jgi:ATP-dependent RNA helicase RhlE
LTTFADLGLAGSIVDSIRNLGFNTPTPIQAKAIPSIIEGRDLLGIAATGTGKTGAFALPILQRLQADPQRDRGCRALILSPTRELAAQIAKATSEFAKGSRIRVCLVIGGASMRAQENALRQRPEIIVATPGRLLDHLKQRVLTLDQVETLVLDEADHMLDLGFIPSVRQLIRAMPAKRQNLFFSATMPREISGLAAEILRDPIRVEITPPSTTAERIDQSAIMIDAGAKAAYLARILLNGGGGRTLVFTRTKRGADKVVRQLESASLSAIAIHGNKSQGQRERALAAFRSAKTPILVATDIAARGIDIDNVTLVVNYDLPEVPETYVHRIGRTARNGAAGKALSLVSGDDRSLLRAIERNARITIPAETAQLSDAERAQAAAMARAGQPERARSNQGAKRAPARTGAGAPKPGQTRNGPRRSADGESRRGRDGDTVWSNYSRSDRPRRARSGRAAQGAQRA